MFLLTLLLLKKGSAIFMRCTCFHVLMGRFSACSLLLEEKALGFVGGEHNIAMLRVVLAGVVCAVDIFGFPLRGRY
jgi:hypothetical protein